MLCIFITIKLLLENFYPYINFTISQFSAKMGHEGIMLLNLM